VRRPSSRRRLPCRATPLHYAASYGEADAIAELLLRGADGAVQDSNG
jgi:ankyrin repeat protein